VKVRELISQLEKSDPEARVFMGYDGNIVVTPAYEVEFMKSENDIAQCWWSVKPGDVVIVSGDQ